MGEDIHIQFALVNIYSCPKCSFPTVWHFNIVIRSGKDIAGSPDFLRSNMARDLMLQSLQDAVSLILKPTALDRAEEIVTGLLGKIPIIICPTEDGRTHALIKLDCPKCAGKAKDFAATTIAAARSAITHSQELWRTVQ